MTGAAPGQHAGLPWRKALRLIGLGWSGYVLGLFGLSQTHAIGFQIPLGKYDLIVEAGRARGTLSFTWNEDFILAFIHGVTKEPPLFFERRARDHWRSDPPKGLPDRWMGFLHFHDSRTEFRKATASGTRAPLRIFKTLHLPLLFLLPLGWIPLWMQHYHVWRDAALRAAGAGFRH